MKMLIFGATGRVGQVVSREARAAGWMLCTPTRAQCDLLRPTAVSDYVLGAGVDAVVNCAAVSQLEKCEADALTAHLVNAMSPGEMALACRHTGARFVHLSTDYVLDGRRPGIKPPDAKCKPVNIYGMSKLEGELQVRENDEDALILRVSWVCGNPQHPSFVEMGLDRALKGEPLTAVVDQYSLPTYAGDIAHAILALLSAGESGIFQVTSVGEPISRYDCLRMALEEAQAEGVLREIPALTPLKLSEVASFRALRPVHTAMDNSALRALGVPLLSVRDCIQRATADFLRASPDRPQPTS